MATWRRTLAFVYDYGQVYLYDSEHAFRDDGGEYLDSLADANRKRLSVGAAHGFVDVLLPDQSNYEAPLAVEGWDKPPPADPDGWEHMVEFDLELLSGRLILEGSGGSGRTEVDVPQGRYRSRWSGAGFPGQTPGEEPSDRYRLQLWPLLAASEPAELKRWWGFDAPGRWPPDPV